MRIPSGTVDQYIYFYAVDATDFVTPVTGLSSFTVYRSRDGGAPAAFTTPTINETSAANMPGVYELLVDEDTTIGAGNDSEELVLHVTHTGMAPVVRTIEIYRPKFTLGSTLSQATIRSSIGLASANLDTQLSTIDGVVDAIFVDTDTTIPGLLGSLNDLSQADIRSAVGLSAADLDTQLFQIDSVVDAVLADTGTTLPAQINALNDLSASDVRTAVGLSSANLDTQLSAIDSVVDSILVDTDTTIPGLISGLNDPSASDIADAVWDEPIAGHTGSGSTGEALSDAGSGASAADIADAVWNEALSGHSTAGSAGEAISSISSDVSDVLLDTDTTIPNLISALNDLSEADIRSAIGMASDNLDSQLSTIAGTADDILADTGTDGVALSAATMNEIADALLTRDWTSVSGEASRSVLNALRFMRNRWSVTGSTLTVYEEDDSTAAWIGSVTTNASADPVTGNDPA